MRRDGVALRVEPRRVDVTVRQLHDKGVPRILLIVGVAHVAVAARARAREMAESVKSDELDQLLGGDPNQHRQVRNGYKLAITRA